MATKGSTGTGRSYGDGCAAAHGLDLVGERWALLVVRELMLGPKRFTDLRSSLPGISPNVLTQRLEELEQASIVIRRKLPPPASVWVYDLTDWGRDLEPVIKAIGRWAASSPTLPQGLPMSVNSLILSFRTMFNAQAAQGLNARIELRLGDNRYQAAIARENMELVAGSVDDPDAVIESEPDALAAVVYGGRKLADAVQSGDMKIKGDKALIKRFVTLFPLPQQAPSTSQNQ